jgi:hypothetical protein
VVIPAALAGIVAAGVALAIALGRGAPTATATPPAKPVELPALVDDAAIAVAPPADAAAPPRTRALVDWIEAANPFVEWRGAQWLAHQVTRREYRQFLESLPARDVGKLQPVAAWNDTEAFRPVGWVTYERATAFCAAIHARLPTSAQWQAASQGDWGLDPAGTGRPGPLQEWTSTVRDGLVAVCGGHERMSAADRRAAAIEPLMKSSEAAAGEGAPARLVAAETIGFRCVR